MTNPTTTFEPIQSMGTELYLDCNATTPVLPQALAAACQTMSQAYGNPSSSHSAGLRAKATLDQARALASALLGVGDGQLVFTSGATEGIQTAVLSALVDLRDRRLHGDATGSLLVYGATEHKAVPSALAHWNTVLGLGLEIRALPVGADGRHDLATLAAWLPQTALLCTMAANNETGVISDLQALDALVRQAPASLLWLVDCVQALGKLPLDLQTTRIDYAPFSGHKLYAPKGVGMLYVRAGSPFTALMAGGGQEGGARAGTENLPGIAALGAVLEVLQQGDTFASTATLTQYRDTLVDALRAGFPNVQFNAPLEACLPTTLNFCIPGLASKDVVDLFDAAGLFVSAGSACSAAKALPSDVLLAMGMTPERAASAIRLSWGALTDSTTIARAAQALRHCGTVAAQTGLLATGDPSHQAAIPSPAAVTATSSVPMSGPSHLDWAVLTDYLQAHPQAQLVDVREAHEHLASGGVVVGGHAADNAPLSQLPQRLGNWLAQSQRPVVFVCRSGKRSLQAAMALQGQGHPQVLHVAGGLALRPAPSTR
jgi:cysteine desulfurase